MSKTKHAVVAVNMLLLLGYFNWSIIAKEQTLKNGHTVLLSLAPVDPRSMMQGDYMALNYTINAVADSLNLAKRGYCIVKMGAHGVATRSRFQSGLQPLNAGEIAIKYFSNSNHYFKTVHIGAESYFFEEGQRYKYQGAKYGCLKVDDNGNSVLQGLCDVNYNLIKN